MARIGAGRVGSPRTRTPPASSKCRARVGRGLTGYIGRAGWCSTTVPGESKGGAPGCLVLVLTDATDAFEAEERFESIFNANPAPALIVRLADLRFARVNEISSS